MEWLRKLRDWDASYDESGQRVAAASTAGEPSAAKREALVAAGLLTTPWSSGRWPPGWPVWTTSAATPAGQAQPEPAGDRPPGSARRPARTCGVSSLAISCSVLPVIAA